MNRSAPDTRPSTYHTGSPFPSRSFRWQAERVAGSRRLGRYMIDRRTELGFDKREPWAAHVKISSKTLSWYERGERLPGDESVAILERALGWEPGSIDAIVAGGTPMLRRSER